MKIKATPKYGAKRTRRKFLFLPLTIYSYKDVKGFNGIPEKHRSGASETLWLEFIEVEEEWKPSRFSYSDHWAEVDWRRLK